MARPADPARAASHSAAVLILPSPERREETVWITALEKYPSLKLTVALSRNDLPLLFPRRAALLDLKNSGRLEPALRLATDPPLPLIYNMDLSNMYLMVKARVPTEKIAWPEDGAIPIVKEKMKHKEFWGSFPAGFVPGGGCLSAAMAEFLAQQKFQWSVAGFPDAEWADDEILSGDIQIMKAHGLSRLFYPGAEEYAPATPCCASAKPLVDKLAAELAQERRNIPVIVFDEQRAKVSLEDFLDALAQQASTSAASAPLSRGEISPQRGGKAVPSLELKLCSFTASPETAEGGTAALQIWPYSWSWIHGLGDPPGPGLTAWVGDDAKNYAWTLLTQTRADMEKYKNSGAADLAKLDMAMEEFYVAESGNFFEWFGSAVELEKKDPRVADLKKQKQMLFKATLENVYRHLDLPLPSSLRRADFSSRPRTARPKATEATVPLPAPSSAAPEPGLIFEWEQRREETGTAADSPALKKLTAAHTENSGQEWINFTISYDGSLDPSAVTDIYIDINHRPGAGTQELIAGRNASVDEADAWELLLMTRWAPSKGWTATLYRSLALSPAVYNTAADYKVSSNPKTTSLRVRVPKQFLGENPANWGFLVTSAQASGPVTDFLSSASDRQNLLAEIGKGGAVRLPMIRGEAALIPGGRP